MSDQQLQECIAAIFEPCLAEIKELRESNDNLRAIAIKSDAENSDLRELNAELLAALKKLDSVSPPLTCVKAAIAKAESLK